MSAYSEMADRDVVPHDEYEDENQLREFFRFVREYFEVEQKWDDVQQFSVEHPVASIFLIVSMVMCTLPVITFAMFVTGSLVVSFAGFLFFEGTVVAVASVFFCGALLLTGFFALGISAFLIIGYHLMVAVGNMLGRMKGQMPSLPFGEKDTLSKYAKKKD